MPRNGMLVRISLVLAAAAALATIAVSAAGAARQSVTLTGAGSTFVQPLITTWTDRRAPARCGNRPLRHLRRRRLWRRCRGHRRTRRPTSVRATRRSARSPRRATRASRSRGRCRGRRSSTIVDGVSGTLKMTGKVLGKIYLGQITYWDDEAYQGSEQGSQPAAHARSRPCTATRRLGRRTTSLTSSRRLRELQGRRSASVPSRNGRAATLRRGTG